MKTAEELRAALDKRGVSLRAKAPPAWKVLPRTIESEPMLAETIQKYITWRQESGEVKPWSISTVLINLARIEERIPLWGVDIIIAKIESSLAACYKGLILPGQNGEKPKHADNNRRTSQLSRTWPQIDFGVSETTLAKAAAVTPREPGNLYTSIETMLDLREHR